MSVSGSRDGDGRDGDSRDGDGRPVFSIAVASELSGLHPQTLRTYERHGLLTPARTVKGTRRFTAHDVLLAQRIAGLSTLGMSMEGVALVLALEAENRRLQNEIARLQPRR